ncbi:MAG: translation initiation factor IF-2 [Candidatus Algichlamydia australiensis]|nr:translation initiation factor IF-2 [Chlamydiales bacterium]
MAKNLKLNIKNSQLAQALNIGKKADEPKEEKKKKAKVKAKTLAPIKEKEKKEEKKPVAAKPPVKATAAPKSEPVEKAEAPKTPPIQPEKLPPVEKKSFTQKAAIKTTEKPGQPPKRKIELDAATKARFAKNGKPKKPSSQQPSSSPNQSPFRTAAGGSPPPGTPRKQKAAPKKPWSSMNQRRGDHRLRHGISQSDDERWRKKRGFKGKQERSPEEIIRPKELKIKLPITIKDLAVEMKLKASALISKLFMQGVALTLNDYLDDETTVQLLGQDFECEITIDTSEEERLQITGKTVAEEIQETDSANLETRAPVVAFMGHVDHGKTSLIDFIRKSKVAAKEAGAITQHIGAFKCQLDHGPLTILDTPGHEAFSAMRERGASATDIVILVVAGDEGIKAQTLEALHQAKEAGVPIIIAINKCDKPNFNADEIYRQLSEQEMLPEAWGGSTITVNCSAKTGEGIETLLEMSQLQGELLELKANPDARARGIILESELHKGLGCAATLLVQNGTLRHGDALVIGEVWGRTKTMHNEHGKNTKNAPPATPVKVTGLSGIPEAGTEFIVVESEKEAKKLCEERMAGKEREFNRRPKTRALDDLLAQEQQRQQKKPLALILRADVQGSLEALKNSLKRLPQEKVELNFINESVGEISESDIELAHASGAAIIGFHTKVESHAEGSIKKLQVDVKSHDVIYHLVDEVKLMMKNLLDKIREENEVGEAEILATFKSSSLGLIAGCKVTDGIIKRSHLVRLYRDGEELFTGDIASLKREKEDVKEVSKGFECGILLQKFRDYQVGDTIKAFEVTFKEQEL